MRTCGVQAHKFPAYESAGTANEASDVGESGEMNSGSCPAMIEVRAQSNRTVAVRRRKNPELTPFGMSGTPPEKSICTSALIFAPWTCGPKTSIPTSDWRIVAPKFLLESSALRLSATAGKSALSTVPLLAKRFKRAMPERRTRYFEALSTLV